VATGAEVRKGHLDINTSLRLATFTFGLQLCA
jgi:hypothetical protein